MVVLRALADSNATHHCCGELWVSDKFSYIDDDDIKQIDAHIKRIKGVLKSSADVVATARQDLEEHRALEDRQSTEPWPGRELISRRATERQATPTKRRALFQRSMRTPSLETAATSPEERQRKSSAQNTDAKDLKTGIGSTSSSTDPKRRSPRLRERLANVRSQHSEIERGRKRDRQPDRFERPRNEEALTPQSSPSSLSSVLLSWTHRLDYLTNASIGLLATALALSLFVQAGQTDFFRDELPLVADAKMSSSQQATRLSSRASLDPTKRSDIVSRKVHAPASSFAQDMSHSRHFLAPLPPPGMLVLPYADLPQARSAFPQDIAQLGSVTSNPDPDGRDYLIRTLVFEASGETEIGKFAVAHAILNRQRSGRWGPKLTDVVTSPWQFEPWMTRKDEIEGLSRADPRYLDAAEIADAVLAGDIPDPTAGATHFLNPVIVRERRGGSLPYWAGSDGRPIGRHVFYCPECDGTKPNGAAVVESGEAKRNKTMPAAADSVKAMSVGQTVGADATADNRAVKAEPAVIRSAGEKPRARSKPKLETQRQQTNLPWLKPTQAMQRAAVVEAGEAKRSKATPAAADRVKAMSVGQTVGAEVPADSREAKAEPAVLGTAGEKPAARSKLKLKTQRRRTDLPWLKQAKARQRRNFIPNIFW